MKKRISAKNRRIWVGVGLLGLTVVSYQTVQKVRADAPPVAPIAIQPYERAIVFQGGGLSTAVALGMLEGVRKEGYNPDVVIGTCGGAIAASIAQIFPNSEDQKKFLESREVHAALSTIHLTKEKHLFRAIGLLAKVYTNKFLKKIPSYFSEFVMEVPDDLPLLETQKPFQTPSDSVPAVVIVAGQMQFGPESQGKPFILSGSYKETFFTDSATAQTLQNFPSPVGQEFPKSYVSSTADIITDATLSSASRASIADPYYIRPAEIAGHYYMTGAVDLFPIEVAHLLAKQTAMPFAQTFGNPVSQQGFSTTFGYSAIDRLKHVTSEYSDYWIDSSDETPSLHSKTLDPGLDLMSFGLVEGIPKDYDTYVQHVEAMWKYGFDRGAESIRLPKNDKTHIRNKTKNNWAG